MQHSALVRASLVALALAMVMLGPAVAIREAQGGGAPRQSTVVLRYDGTGTEIFKVFPDGSEWTIGDSFLDNSVNGTVRDPSGGSTFINCLPQDRTNESADIVCRIFDATTQAWGDPMPVTVEQSFLENGFANPYNSIFEVTGRYSFTFDDGTLKREFPLLFLDGLAVPGVDFPILTGVSEGSSTIGLGRYTDIGRREPPYDSPARYNFFLYMETTEKNPTDERCIFLFLNPTGPRTHDGSSVFSPGVLAGVLRAAAKTEGGECGSIVFEGPGALIPAAASSAGPGRCPYRVANSPECTGPNPLTIGQTVCIPCTSTCGPFAAPTRLFTDAYPSYGSCSNVMLDAVAGAMCLLACEGKVALPVVELSDTAGRTALGQVLRQPQAAAK